MTGQDPGTPLEKQNRDGLQPGSESARALKQTDCGGPEAYSGNIYDLLRGKNISERQRTWRNVGLGFLILSLLGGSGGYMTDRLSSRVHRPKIDVHFADFSVYKNADNIRADRSSSFFGAGAWTPRDLIKPGEHVVIELDVGRVMAINGNVIVENVEITREPAINPSDAQLLFEVTDIEASQKRWGNQIREENFEIRGVSVPMTELEEKPIRPWVGFRLPDDDALWDTTIIVRIKTDVIYPVRKGSRHFRNVLRKTDKRYAVTVASNKILQAEQGFVEAMEKWRSQRRPLDLSSEMLFILMLFSLLVFVLIALGLGASLMRVARS